MKDRLHCKEEILKLISIMSHCLKTKLTQKLVTQAMKFSKQYKNDKKEKHTFYQTSPSCGFDCLHHLDSTVQVMACPTLMTGVVQRSHRHPNLIGLGFPCLWSEQNETIDISHK